MDELDQEELQKLEDETRKLRARMKTQNDTRMKTLSTLLDQFPEEHPDLVKFRQELVTERAANNAELKKLGRMQVSRYFSLPLRFMNLHPYQSGVLDTIELSGYRQ